MKRSRPTDGPTRRNVLLGLGAGTVALAGCLGGGTSDGAENVPVLGNPDADVVLEVYEDLGCPACAEYQRTGFPTIERDYIETGQIRYEHRDLMTTNEGPAAANAAREVLERHGNDAFWEFKSAVFANQGDLGTGPVEVLRDIAQELEFDADEIATAADERAHEDAIDADRSRASSLGASSTPSFAVDESLVGRGANAVADVTQELNQALQ